MPNRVTHLAVCILLMAFQCSGQQEEPSGGNRPLEPIPSMRKTVGFIRVVYQKNGATWESKGTGFFAAVEDKRLPDGQSFVYFVTNRHVAQPEEGEQGVQILNAYLRLNQRSPEAGEEAVELALPLGPHLHWYFPADEADDLAVLPLGPALQKFDIRVVPTSAFATRDVVASERIAEGDKVLFTGFFYQFPGLKRLEPIVREGIVAMMPTEKMQTTLRKPGDLYLGDVHVFGGNSGSPVFVNTGGTRGSRMGGDHYLLLGIVSGYMYEDADFRLIVATTSNVRANSGVCTIVPVDKLKALLEQPELQKLRDDVVERVPSNK